MKIKSLIGLLVAGVLVLNACKKDEGEDNDNKNNNPNPVDACFTVSTVSPQVGDTVMFTDCSANGLVYTWDFGDGQSSTQPSTQHIYQAAGTYNVRLNVVGASGADTASKTITATGVNVNTLYGTYQASESCTLGTATYVVIVSASGSGGLTILINNLYGNGSVVQTTIYDGNKFTIQPQNIGSNLTLSGNGTFNGNVMNLTYTINDGSQADNCSLTATKQ